MNYTLPSLLIHIDCCWLCQYNFSGGITDPQSCISVSGTADVNCALLLVVTYRVQTCAMPYSSVRLSVCLTAGVTLPKGAEVWLFWSLPFFCGGDSFLSWYVKESSMCTQTSSTLLYMPTFNFQQWCLVFIFRITGQKVSSVNQCFLAVPRVNIYRQP